MLVHVEYDVEVSDRYRRAIRHHYGRPGLASRTEVIVWLCSYGSSCDDDLIDELLDEEGDEGVD